MLHLKHFYENTHRELYREITDEERRDIIDKSKFIHSTSKLWTLLKDKISNIQLSKDMIFYEPCVSFVIKTNRSTLYVYILEMEDEYFIARVDILKEEFIHQTYNVFIDGYDGMEEFLNNTTLSRKS